MRKEIEVLCPDEDIVYISKSLGDLQKTVPLRLVTLSPEFGRIDWLPKFINNPPL
jgi:hypothetical protein